MKRFSQPGTVHTYGFSPGDVGKVYFYIYCEEIGECSSLHLSEETRYKPRLTRVDSHMVLVVGGTGEGPSTARLGAVVWPLSGVCSDVDFADVGGGKGPAAALDWAFERLLSCNTRDGDTGQRGEKSGFKGHHHYYHYYHSLTCL